MGAGDLEVGADGPRRVGQLGVGPPLDARLAGRRPREAEHHAQRGRLAGAVRPEEARHGALAHRERQVVDGDDVGVALREAGSLDRRAARHGRALPLLRAARRAEADDLVGSVAERPHARLAAATQRDGAPADLDRVAVLVGEAERPAHEERPVPVRRDRRPLVHVARTVPADGGSALSLAVCRPMLLEGRKLLVTGVLTESSIAFSIARRAQEEGAELVLTGFGRGLRITQRVAKRLPTEPDVLELDVNDPE